jgi:hypothetical protein
MSRVRWQTRQERRSAVTGLKGIPSNGEYLMKIISSKRWGSGGVQILSSPEVGYV